MRWLFLLLGSVALAQAVATPGWVRLVPPVVKDTAAYLTLENRGKLPLRLVGAETDVAERVSFHQDYREHRGGQVVLGMRPLPYLDIPPGGRVEFRPGKYHLMLEGLKRPLKAGEKVALVLRFQDGSRLKVILPVEMR
ncbi:copper chaperone PCu(A)C [Thermus thermophilus]|uniref:Transporter n=1 Tax=Thermus thermophilus TaxID=274 RepID=A0AAD1NYY6_THETH|nr:copper chaperone PCu(A)C [Thermus thermophilus]BCZ87876.1 transporter [Thermus thermophilus]